MNNRLVIAGALAVLVGGGAWWALSGDEASPARDMVASQTSPGAGASTGTHHAGAAPAAPANPNAAVTVTDSMGATLDAARLFELGFGGGLVIDRNTLGSIEAVVNSMPDPPSEQDLARLERTLREGLPKDDAEKAFKLFKDYRSYTTDVRQEMMPKGIPSTVAEAHKFFDEMDAVRRRHFDDATANALFGKDDHYARLTMVASLVEQDPKLSAEQKKEQIDALRNQLPADQRSLIPDPAAASSAASQPGA